MKQLSKLFWMGMICLPTWLIAQSDANIGRMGTIGSGVSSGGGIGGGNNGGGNSGGGNWGGSDWGSGSSNTWDNSSSSYSNTRPLLDGLFTGSMQTNSYTRPTAPPTSYEELVRWEQNWLRMGDKALTTSLTVRPPFSGVDVAVQTFRLDAAKGGKIELANGTVIEVPKAAFMDKTGKPAEGEVELNYREFHNAADIIASGIPMHDPQTGQYMETAGMFEIGAQQGDRELALQPDKSVKVKMASYNEGNDFDFWSYNPETGNWREQDGAGQVPAQRLRRGGDANPRANADVQAALSRSFSISSMGIHNWDRMASAMRASGDQSIEFIFDEQVTGITDWTTIPFFFITRNGRAVIGHSRQSAETVRFEPYSKDALVAILPGNRVAVFTGSDYGKMDRSGTTLTYYFKTAEKPIESVAQLAQVLKLQ